MENKKIEGAFDPQILEGEPKGPAHRIATVVVTNEAGRTMRVNTNQLGEMAKKGYTPDNENDVKAAGLGEKTKIEYTLTEVDFEQYTVNELKDFCDGNEPEAIAYKAGWNKPDFIAALLEAEYVPQAAE